LRTSAQEFQEPAPALDLSENLTSPDSL
jgi:hypothetical protein